MSTTTIRLPDDLKLRVVRLAEAAGLTAHGFIVQAIEAQAAAAEEQAEFQRLARARLRKFKATGVAVPWSEARQYLLDRAAGKDVPRPKAVKVVP